MKFLKAIPFLVIAVLVLLHILQKREIDRLASDNRALSARLTAIEQQPVVEDTTQADELARLRKEQGELLKLRGELNVMKRQLQEAKAQAKAISQVEPPNIPVEKASPVKKFETRAEMTLQQGESAVVGGWETSPGKRTIVLATPTVIGASGAVDPNGDQITVEARFIELPQTVFNSHFVLGQDGSLKQTFGDTATRQLLKQLKDAEGVDATAAPRITTLSGRQAQMSVLNEQTIDGKKYEFGSTLDIIPTKGANGSIQLTMIPSVNLRNNAAGE